MRAGARDGGLTGERPQPASLTDVARLAGVSPATASRALDLGRLQTVAEATRIRVQEAAARLGYRPNPLARGLRARPTDTMAVIVHDILYPYFSEVARGAGEAAAGAGYLTIYVSSGGELASELHYLDLLRHQRVAAVLFAASGTGDSAYQDAVAARVEGIRAYGGAVVALGPRTGPWPTERVDLRAGSRLGTEHLIELGHRRIASVFPPENLATTAERMAGHVEALRTAGLEPATPVHSEIALPAAAAAAASLVAGAKFTALFVASDTLAVGVLGELRRRGVRVPEDVSVVGFGGLVDWENRSPALTTVRTFPGKLGAAGVRRALDLLAGKDGPPRVRLHPVELVVRESTRRLPRHAWSLRRPGTPAAP